MIRWLKTLFRIVRDYDKNRDAMMTRYTEVDERVADLHDKVAGLS